jgi:hypothetical protein
MDVEISVSDPGLNPRTLKNLQDWLLEEPSLVDCPITRPPAIPEPGQMGALSEVLVVALGSGGSAAALAGSLSVWLSTRVNHVTITVRNRNGEVKLDARSTTDPKELIEAFAPLVSDSDARSS